MSKSHREALQAEFEGALGAAIIAWNQAEMVIRGLLVTLSGDGMVSYILTAELGSQGIIDALNAIAPMKGKELRVAIVTVSAYYERLRAYRNYYVHGLMASGSDGKEASGLIYTSSAKGKFGIAQDIVPIDQVKWLRERCLDLMKGGAAITSRLRLPELPAEPPILPTPQTLVRPPPLRKSLRYPLNDPPPPQTDGG
jgi:hypothetical protein